MRIVMLAIGTSGDVQPYIALGLGLQKAGHQVCLATHDEFCEDITGRGLDFASIGIKREQWTSGGRLQSLVDADRNFLRWARQLAHLAAPLLERVIAGSWNACQGAEAVFYSPLTFVGYCIAQKMQVPCYAAFLEPVTRTRAFPMPWLAADRALGSAYNYGTYLFAEQAFWQAFRRHANRWRQDVLGLDPLPLAGPFGQPEWQRQPILYGYSPAVLPRPPDWPACVHVTGYWLLDCTRNWQPPPELSDFLAAGSPPVYVGFGSMPDPDPEALTKLVLEALACTGQRGLLQRGRWGLSSPDLPDEVMQIGHIPHGWLFPQMAAVVHHGGAGTSAAALQAGVPSIVTPFAWDQRFWGQRMAGMGVGPPPIPRKQLSAERLAAAIRMATSDREMRARARALGRRIQAEDGVARAVSVFHGHFSPFSWEQTVSVAPYVRNLT